MRNEAPLRGRRIVEGARQGDSQQSLSALGRQAGEMLLAMTEEDPDREGLKDTPARVAEAYSFLFSGYRLNPEQAVGRGVFAAEGPGLVAVEKVEFFSMCEHHLLPFWGSARVAYYPNKSILGLSKIPRLVDLFARRVQVQERLTRQVGEALLEILDPRAVVVQMNAQHMCMMMRGVEKHASSTSTEFCWGLDQLEEHERQRILG